MIRRFVPIALVLASCTDNKPSSAPAPSALPSPSLPVPSVASTPATVPSAVATTPSLAPLAGEWLQKLESPGGVVDYVAPPLGATGARPVVVALHGMDARPEWLCNDFRATFGPWPFIVCARGDARSPANYSWGSTVGMQRAISRALAATEARFPGYVATEGRVLVTYSQSASMAPAMLASPAARGDTEPVSFAGGFFLEGFTKNIGGLAAGMTKRGLTHAVFFSMQAGNRAPAEASAKALRRAGATASAEYGGALGHWFTPKTVPALRKGVPTLVSGLAGWESYPGPEL